MHAGITPFIIGLIYKSKWYKLCDHYDRISTASIKFIRLWQLIRESTNRHFIHFFFLLLQKIPAAYEQRGFFYSSKVKKQRSFQTKN